MTAKLHRNPPFCAEHLGSLLRTERLLEVRHENEAGKAKDSELRAVEDTDVKDIVKLQLDLGYHAITDGEYRRHSTYPGSQRICFGSQTHIR
jgi:methionine synthase II (cobalamin-independent)